MSIQGIRPGAELPPDTPSVEPETQAPGGAAPAAPSKPALAGQPAAAPPATVRTDALAAGRATRRSDGPEGKEHVLEAHHQKRAERLFKSGPPDVARALDEQLASIGGKDAPLARAIFLKAAAARSSALMSTEPELRAAALATLGAFAKRLDGMPAADLLAKSSVVDLDSRVSTSDFDPMGTDAEHGKLLGKGGAGDTRKDNDGLFQRFTSTCGPTTLQLALCEEDPVRAFAAHDAGLTSMSSSDLVAQFQQELLERYKGVAVSRDALYRFTDFKLEVKKLRKAGELPEKDIDALRDYVTNKGELTKGAQRTLEAMRAARGGFPTDADLATIRAGGFPKEDSGLDMKEFSQMLNENLTPATGQRYKLTSPPDGVAKGQAGRHLDAVEKALKRGVDVPFGISEPGHWMLLSAVAGKAPDRRWLMNDPWTGITAWVGEKELVKGSFIVEPFELEEKKKAGYIDSFFIPEEVG